ncbi:hypothetical protein ACI3KS_03060 [Microbacterium sp. ZW T5_45]|uniref:hypothetical protein n=1 Tax=Microbacterium sp. ZW T5_45 TaxID=3378080 RepID=UPI003851E382
MSNLPPEVQAIADRIGEAWAETIDVGPGWFDLITRLDMQLARLSPGYVVEQCKTKYGSLRYYARPEDSEEVDLQMTFNEIIRDAEDQSTSICEECGQPGQQITSHGWIRTLCKTHTQPHRQNA